jgi:hypothetical protein
MFDRLPCYWVGEKSRTDLVFERDADLSGRALFGHVTGGIRVSTAAWLCMAQRSSVDGIDGLIAALLAKSSS